MGFYDEEESVNQYIEMVRDYDNRFIINFAEKFIPSGSRLLEIGIGPGKDMDSLQKKYDVTGSDYSPVFLDKYRKKNPQSDLLLLNAETLETNLTFDALFSNKVLHHLSPDQLVKSFKAQNRILNPGGVLFHTFWYGQGVEEIMGLFFHYYSEENLKRMIGDQYEILNISRYQEEEEDDSIVLVLKK